MIKAQVKPVKKATEITVPTVTVQATTSSDMRRSLRSNGLPSPSHERVITENYNESQVSSMPHTRKVTVEVTERRRETSATNCYIKTISII